MNIKPKVLIVDDSKIVLSLHSFILGNAGYECVTAESGYEALEQLNLHSFEILLTDLNMPRMDGYELVRKVRSMANYAQTPIIMISTEQEAQDKAKGIEAGANLYIVKPTQPELLIANVKMLVPLRSE